MAYDHYGQFGDDADRNARDRDYDRNRSQNRSRNDEPGFFERAGEEIKSWFSDDDDQGRRRDYDHRSERDRSYRSQSGFGRDPNVNRYGERGAHNMGRGYEPERDRPSMSRGSSWDDRSSPYRSYGSNDSSSDRYSSADRGNEYGSQSSRYGTQDRQYGSRSGQSGRSYGRSRDDDDSELLIYEEISGTLGGFGNQRFASSQDDHYRNWRDRQMAQLDQDYQDYCRDCEQKFHSDFDTWRSQRQGQQSQSEMASSSGSGSSSRSSQDAGSASRTTGQQSSGSSSAIGGDRSKSTESSASKQPETASSSSSRSGSNRSTS
jgi:hypothetical protein